MQVQVTRMLVIAGLLTTTACGSTVATTGAGTADGYGGAAGRGVDPVTSGVAGPPGEAAGTGTTSVAAGQGTEPGLRAVTPAARGGDSAATKAGTLRDANGTLRGPGVTKDTVTIGITYIANADAANAAVGASGITQGDTKGEAKAVIDDINAHGGVAGRKLTAVFHAYDATSGEPKASQDQGACSDFTQDHKVFAVAASGLTESFAACIAKAGALQVYSGDTISGDDAFFHKYPHYNDLATLSQDRMMRDFAAALSRRGWFGGWNASTGSAAPTSPAKVGILTIDKPEWNRPLDKVLLPALAKAGHPVAPADVYRVKTGESSTNTGATVADIQSAALRFRNDGVSHVILLDATGALTLFFAQNAKNQRYFPRFGANSGSGLQVLVDAGVLDPAQLHGALGIAWLPRLDLKPELAKQYAGPGTARCLEVMRKGGYTFPDANSAAIALSICDELYFIADAINGAGESVTLAEAQAAVDRLGTRFQTALLPAASFAPAKHDGVELIYDLAWDDSCSCSIYLDKGHRSD